MCCAGGGGDASALSTFVASVVAILGGSAGGKVRMKRVGEGSAAGEAGVIAILLVTTCVLSPRLGPVLYAGEGPR